MMLEEVRRLLLGVKKFKQDMASAGTHIGMPDVDGQITCVSCGQFWPCSGGKQ